MNIVVLLAGGMGSRMGQDIPKQFIHVNNILKLRRCENISLEIKIK